MVRAQETFAALHRIVELRTKRSSAPRLRTGRRLAHANSSSSRLEFVAWPINAFRVTFDICEHKGAYRRDHARQTLGSIATSGRVIKKTVVPRLTPSRALVRGNLDRPNNLVDRDGCCGSG